MLTMPAIDMVATGRNIAKMRQNAGLTVKDLQILFGFATPQAIYKWQHGTAMPTEASIDISLDPSHSSFLRRIYLQFNGVKSR